MTGADACLLDSNILLRMGKVDDPNHLIDRALHALLAGSVRLCYTSQALGEFWNVSTRPLDKNGFGLTIPETDRLARLIERDLIFLPDSQVVHVNLRDFARFKGLSILHPTDVRAVGSR